MTRKMPNKEWLEDEKEQLNKAIVFINENRNEAIDGYLSLSCFCFLKQPFYWFVHSMSK